MRVGSLSGRLVLIGAGPTALDVEKASRGLFGSSPQAVYERWDEFRAWAKTADFSAAIKFDQSDLGAPANSPRQLFAIALNYGSHANEVGQATTSVPVVFTKFISCLTGPYAPVPHPGGSVDWEAELVIVIGRGGYRIPVDKAWDHVAGVTAGQDISERDTQHSGDLPQFTLGKSFPGFGPMGPWLVTPDELEDKEDLEMECWVNGELMQQSRTSAMILPVDALVSRLSEYTPLLAGDVIYSGTPAGVGLSRKPPRFLAVGDIVTTTIEGIGTLRNPIVAGR